MRSLPVSILIAFASAGCLPSGPLVTDLAEPASPGPADGGPIAADAGVDGAAPADLGPPAGALDPARGAGSGGTGGVATSGVAMRTTASGVAYRLIVPASYTSTTKIPLLLVYSGTEGGAQMAQNLAALPAAVPSLGGYVCAVLDGVTYNGNGMAGADVLDEVRGAYNVDNDRTYLLGESAGTTAAFTLGFHLRQRYFAAYWANDVAAGQADGPLQTASQLGFAPFGQVGPGGAAALAAAVAAKLVAAGYRTDATTPYAGAGAGTHGDPDQFISAIAWFDGKTR